MSAEQDDDFTNRELDREEIAMEEQNEPKDLPHFTVIDPDGPEFPALPDLLHALMQSLKDGRS